MTAKKLLKIILIFTIIAIIGGYAYYQSRNVIAGPQLTILSPIDGSSTTEPFTLITGTTKNISKISVNDRLIFTDTSGNFTDAIVLLSGYNLVTIKVEGKFGKEITEVLELVLKENEMIQEMTEKTEVEKIDTTQDEEGLDNIENRKNKFIN